MWWYILGLKWVADNKLISQEESREEPTLKQQFFYEKWKRKDNGEFPDWLVLMKSASQCYAPAVCSMCPPAVMLIAVL